MSERDILELAPESRPPELEEQRKGFWAKLRQGLSMTHNQLLERVDAAMEGRSVIDDETLEYLEESLIGADLGVEASLEIVEAVRERARAYEAQDPTRLRTMLADEIAILLLDAPQPPRRPAGPRVTLVVGVNGVGKTTSIAKLARRSLDEGDTVLLVAGDTFRAAAVEQIALWGERLGVEVVRQSSGADPAAVVYDGLAAARSRAVDHVIVDTAGRLHTKKNLMAELEKIRRVVEREAPDRHLMTLLVLDATTGQNAIAQAREFTRVVSVDAVLLAKIDGTAKGGVAVAVARDLRLPVLYLGVGEGASDLVDFRPREFAAALLA